MKCSVYLQSWPQRAHPPPRVRWPPWRWWDPEANEFCVEQQVRADVSVFAIQTQRDPDLHDMLDLSYWQFWVVNGAVIREFGQKSVGHELGAAPRDRAGPIPRPRGGYPRRRQAVTVTTTRTSPLRASAERVRNPEHWRLRRYSP